MIFISDDENKDYDTPYLTYFLVGLIVCGTVAAGLALTSPGLQRSIEGFTLGQALGAGFGPLLLGAKLKALGAALGSLQAFKLFSGIFAHPNFITMLWCAMLLWVFGDNVEYAMGTVRYAVFFFVCGALTAIIDALLTHTAPGLRIAFGPGGAVAAVAGAYAAYYPKAKLKVEIHFGGRHNHSLVFGSYGRRGKSSTSHVEARNFIALYGIIMLALAFILPSTGIKGVPYTIFPFWGTVAGLILGYGLSYVFRDYNVLFTLDEEKQEYVRPRRTLKPAYDPFAPEPTPEQPPAPTTPPDDGKTF
jgi:membrane associated rhomboid family serine protease